MPGNWRWSIRPLIDPAMAVPGDPDYPDPNSLTVVFGVAIDGEARAYRMGDLTDREVVDDRIADVTLAATGWTWLSTFVLWDQETESTWFGGSGDQGWRELICSSAKNVSTPPSHS